MKKVRVCTHLQCPELQPCPHHSRPANATWSKDRNTKEHLALRRYLIKTRGPRCERDGCTFTTTAEGRGLHMHHIKPGNTPTSVILLCRACHKTLDPKAR